MTALPNIIAEVWRVSADDAQAIAAEFNEQWTGGGNSCEMTERHYQQALWIDRRVKALHK